MIRTVAEYHAALPEEIRNEQQRIGRSLSGESVSSPEMLMRSSLKFSEDRPIENVSREDAR